VTFDAIVNLVSGLNGRGESTIFRDHTLNIVKCNYIGGGQSQVYNA
jgi:hypothetical protein